MYKQFKQRGFQQNIVRARPEDKGDGKIDYKAKKLESRLLRLIGKVEADNYFDVDFISKTLNINFISANELLEYGVDQGKLTSSQADSLIVCRA